jgi:D-alanine-D-alanine ligase
MIYGLLFGAESYEHEISIVSAITLKDRIREKKVYIFCDANREFYLIDEKNMRSDYFASFEYKKATKLSIKKGGFYQKALMGEKRVELDLVINLVHGGDGEDGKFAAIFEFFDIPFIGPRVEASVFSFNKLYTKLYAKEIGVNVLDYELLKKGAYKISFDYPVIIKPLRLGSSIGVSIVKDADELEYALDVAYEFDDEVLVEPFIEGVKEYNLAGAKTHEYLFSIIEEPNKGEYLDFEKKYLDFSRDEEIEEADIDSVLKENLKLNFKKIYGSVFEGSIIRCDFFVIDEKVYLNEINPIPGSLANYLFLDFDKVLEELSNHLPKPKKIAITYQYINSIQKAKGKA